MLLDHPGRTDGLPPQEVSGWEGGEEVEDKGEAVRGRDPPHCISGWPALASRPIQGPPSLPAAG